MVPQEPQAYTASGVSIERGERASKFALEEIPRTFNNFVKLLGRNIAIDARFAGMKNPVLGFSADGTGTKNQYARITGNDEVIGHEAVAMNANDVVRGNFEPIAFLNAITFLGEHNQVIFAKLIEGMVKACQEVPCNFVGGENAEHPGEYPKDEYIVDGFVVGVCDRDKVITGEKVAEGDIVVAYPSYGLHDNGYSLARKILPPEEMENEPEILRSLLIPTRIYVNEVLGLNSVCEVHAWAHITGGGLIGKISEIIPLGLQVNLNRATWNWPEIFTIIQQKGNLSDAEMYSTFNCGLGMVGIVSEKDIPNILEHEQALSEDLIIVGRVIRSSSNERVSLIF